MVFTVRWEIVSWVTSTPSSYHILRIWLKFKTVCQLLQVPYREGVLGWKNNTWGSKGGLWEGYEESGGYEEKQWDHHQLEWIMFRESRSTQVMEREMLGYLMIYCCDLKIQQRTITFYSSLPPIQPLFVSLIRAE